jgi:hypothetical protein
VDNHLPESLLNARKAGIEYFMGKECEWKQELEGSVKRIEDLLGCAVYAFANNGFGDHLFLKHCSDSFIEIPSAAANEPLHTARLLTAL